MAADILNNCMFNPTLGGTTDWTVSTAVTGYMTPTAAGAVNGATYKYRAESLDLSQWEYGEGTWNSGTGVLSRTTVIQNSSGTTSKINFTTAPFVGIVHGREDTLFNPSPALTGTPTAPTAAAGTNTTQIATTAFVTGAVREKLTAARTYYVRTDGSNSNTGLANTSGGAFLTIGKALDVAAALDCSIYQLTISVQAGTYTAAVTLPKMVGTIIPILQGVGSTTIISTTSATCFTGSGAISWIVKDMKLTTATSGHCIYTIAGCYLQFSGIEFGASAGYHIFVGSFSAVVCVGNYSISGGAQYHVANNGYCDINTVTVTLSSTPAFSAAFALSSSPSYFRAYSITFSGTGATGVRYSVTMNGVIFTNGGGASYFPGNSAGSTATGGQYV